MPNVDQLVSELELSLVALEEHGRAEPAIAKWLIAQRARLMALRSAVASASLDSKMLSALAEVTGAEDDSVGVALGHLTEMTNAERGFIVLRARDGSLSFPAYRTAGADDHEPQSYISRSILRATLLGKTSVTVADALADERFARHESVQALALRAVLAVPIATHGEAWGAVYLDNPLRSGAFSAPAVRAAEQFARIIGPIFARDLALGEVDREHAERLRTLRTEHDFADIVGESDALIEVLSVVARIAPTDAAVLIRGETGTGKELIAQKIHQLSRRSGKPFVALDCGAVPSELIESELFGHERGPSTKAPAVGRFEAADGGTVFLDEVGELTPGAQARLLRVLADGTSQRVGATETRRVDVRIVAATGRDLHEEVAAGRFRQELLYRLDVIRLRLPSLREREGDAELIAQHLLERIGAEHNHPEKRFHPSALAAIREYSWPGNVRELANLIERGVILSPTHFVMATHLGLSGSGERIAVSEDPGSSDMKAALRAYKRDLVERALAASAGDNAAAARRLGVHPKYLYQLIRELSPAPSPGPVSTTTKKLTASSSVSSKKA
ncbi:MAG: sigma-54-dependent Fis family transcriptional regulator [Labilithrix sp.]